MFQPNSYYKNNVDTWNKDKSLHYINSAFSSSKVKVTLKKIVIDLKIVPTRSFGTCHVIEFLKCNRCRNIVITLLYKQGLKLMDVPKSFNIYFTPRNSWQGIVTNYRTLPEPYKVDTFESGLVWPRIKGWY